MTTLRSNMVYIGSADGSVAPGDRVICGGEYATVQRVTVFPPNQGEHGCIRADYYAVKVETSMGVRWAGGTSASIGSNLRVRWTR